MDGGSWDARRANSGRRANVAGSRSYEHFPGVARVTTEEKVFSVIAETRDGTTQTLSVRGRTPGEVFQQVKEMPGIRRVGRVTEVTRGGDRAGKAVERHRPHAAPGSTAAGSRDLGIGRPMSGPRVVIPARPTGG